jgi:hypothetical protein
LGGTPALQKIGLKSGFEMILESPSPSNHGDASSTPTALPALAKEKATHGVANLERFARFSTQRVLNFSPRLKTPRKTRELEFGTRCVPNPEEDLTIEFYTDERIAEFHQAVVELAAEIEQGMRELKGMLK